MSLGVQDHLLHFRELVDDVAEHVFLESVYYRREVGDESAYGFASQPQEGHCFQLAGENVWTQVDAAEPLFEKVL